MKTAKKAENANGQLLDDNVLVYSSKAKYKVIAVRCTRDGRLTMAVMLLHKFANYGNESSTPRWSFTEANSFADRSNIVQ